MWCCCCSSDNDENDELRKSVKTPAAAAKAEADKKSSVEKFRINWKDVCDKL